MSPTRALPNRPRPTRAQTRAATREQLLDSAIALVADNGVASTSLDQIAENAGFSRGAFHSNFADKTELMQSVIDSITRRAQALLDQAIAAASTSNLQLAAYIRTYMGFVAEHPRDARAMVAVVTEQHASGAEPYECRAASSIDDLVRVLTTGQENGQMRDFDAPLMALLIRTSLDTQVRRVGISPEALGRAADELVRTFDLATRNG